MGQFIRRDLTQEYVRELFDYDAESGVLRWKVRKAQCIQIGDVAGNLNGNGYYQTKIDNILYLNHRIIFLWVRGFNPEHIIDHINKDKSDNRICNLREVTSSCNVINGNIRNDNKSGVTGIHQISSGKYIVQAQNNGKRVCVGRYDSLFDAVLARYGAELKFYGKLCNSKSSAYQYLEKHGYFNTNKSL